MEFINEKENFLFNEDTRFKELLIMSEMESEEEYEILKNQILKSLDKMYKNREQINSSDIILLQKSKVYRVRKTYLLLGIKLDESVAQEALNQMTFPEYAKHLGLRLVFAESDEIDNHSEESKYVLSVEGLLEAVKEFNGIADENNLI